MDSTVIKIRTPMFENVANLIRRRILVMELQRGEHLNEVTLSRELSISRGPVRDAIKLLEKEGLVETSSNGRTIVVGFTRSSFQDWTRTRIMFERFAIEEFSRRQGTKVDSLNKLDEIIQSMRLLNDQQKDLKASIDLDLRFHRHLISMSENRTLIISWESIYYTLTTIMELIAENYGSILEQTKMHAEIARKLIEQDYNGAALLLSHHIEEGEKTMLSALQF